MKRWLFLLGCMLIFVAFSSMVYGYCNPGSPTISNAAPAISGSPDCTERINRSFNIGESTYETIALKKGDVYSAAATGCPRAGNIRISITKDGQEYAYDNNDSPRFCFVAPEDGDYRFNVTLKTTYHNSSWGNVNACIYKANSCR